MRMTDISIPPWRKSLDSKRQSEFHTVLLKSAQAAKRWKETPFWAQQTITYHTKPSPGQTNLRCKNKNAKKLKAHQLTWQRANPLLKHDLLIYCASSARAKDLVMLRCAAMHLAKLALAFVSGLFYPTTKYRKPMACTCAAEHKVKLRKPNGTHVYHKVHLEKRLLMLRGWGVTTV